MTRIKICGLTREEEIEAVNEALPDYIGFVFASTSRRRLSFTCAHRLRSYLNPSIMTVGVFVDEDIDNVVGACECGIVDVVQLHGTEDDMYIKALKAGISNEIIKAIRVRDHRDVEAAKLLPSDYLLFDTYHQGTWGGTGMSFDWSLIAGVERPFFLAGGINEDNIDKAIEQCRPYCVDVSSSVETNGYKDPTKIKSIVRAVRKLDKGQTGQEEPCFTKC